ncbi:MAG: hypothetical protein M2R46_05167 [Verrucomicrobia subdivision 3 bacterium]|nr:hypothetical protein [Limisphaerales bacterium]
MTNHERVGKGLELLKVGLGSFVEREVKGAIEVRKLEAHKLRYYAEDPRLMDRPIVEWDVAGLLKLMWETWNEVFRDTLGPAERGFVGELRGHRNRWAHQENFSSDDAYRVLDSAGRLLAAVSAPQAGEVSKLKMELLRVRFEEQARGERRKHRGTTIETAAAGNLKPWREVVEPHEDVASGCYQQAEFAADLWQVHCREGSDEYRNPVEFFRRTYLTESLKSLLTGAIRRLTGQGGDPVVQLQTNFGGGKTHSMLALYHLFSDTPPTELAGIEEVMGQVQMKELPQPRRVVLVGTKISPGNPVTKEDGTVVRTLWGELAWQLGGTDAYAKIAKDDEQATSPGDKLRELFNKYGPCLILIDEWVAYARQLHDQRDLPAGDFETQFSFAQVLTESAKLADKCLLVVSLPASDMTASPHSQPEDVEVGGLRGRTALDRLRNVIGRIESSWQPASAEESFEIVRRRLFKPFADPARFKDRDVVARAFADFYRLQQQEFPQECSDSAYEKRIVSAYPIHPEVFDRLYNDWSTLVKFQRTRGVLRLMAAVIHSLWEKDDRSPLILPAHFAIDDRHVQSELTRYLSDAWRPIIATDVDGSDSLPLRIDAEVGNLGKYAACRRVARTIYLGSAPAAGTANRGLDDRRVKLGCVMPGEPTAVFGDALRRLAAVATYLYQDGQRYWYDTQPTVTKLVEDQAEHLKREPDKVAQELSNRLRKDLEEAGGFKRIHPLPQSGHDVPDDLNTGLVVLGTDHLYIRGQESTAEAAAKAILESRGNTPRIYRNTLVFLAADKGLFQDLDEAVRRYLAWDRVLKKRETLDLSPHQVKQAESQHAAASSKVTAQIPEAYQWLLIPEQKSTSPPVEWKAIKLRLSGQGSLAVRASKKLKSDELLISAMAPTSLRMELDRVPLWRGDHVSVQQIVQYFAQYPYLPRVSEPSVLLKAISEGVLLLTWEQEGFAYADGFDEEAGRYRGLRGGVVVNLPDENAPGLLVKPAVAAVQLAAESAEPVPGQETAAPGGERGSGSLGVKPGTQGEIDGFGAGPKPVPEPAPLKRFHGSVSLDPTRVGRDAGQIAEEVISHLAALPGATVRVTLEIEAETPNGATDTVVRTVTENSRTLRFKSQGFEQE